MNIHPTGCNVLLEVIEQEKANPSGIIVPEGIKDKKRSLIGKVVVAGPAITAIVAGDQVLFAEYGFEPVELDGKKYQIGLEENILAILEDVAR